MKMGWYRLLAVVNALFFAANVLITYVTIPEASNGTIAGQLSGELPELLEFFGIHVSIWAIIYILQLGFLIYQLYKVFRASEPPLFFERIGVFYLIACVFNTAWIYTWHIQIIWLSLIMMFGLLITLTIIYVRLRPGLEEFTIRQQWMLTLPFSVYTGWVTIAAVANVTTALSMYGLNGWGISATAWTIIMISVSTVITASILYIRRDLGFAAVVIWGFTGIIIKQMANYPDEGLKIIIAAVIGMAVLLVDSIIALIRTSRTTS
jgi:hypothetical protein